MRLALGTVQFGLDYGVTNVGGKSPASEVARIIDRAASGGVGLLDTAPAYGDSEQILGVTLQPRHRFRIVTKTVRPAHNAAAVEAGLRESLRRLRTGSVYAVLAHDADDLLGPHGADLYRRLTALRDAGLAQKIGASVYSGAQIDALLSRMTVDVVQAPISVLDQRLIVGGQLQRLKASGVEVHARSVFLQGLLVTSPERLPPYFQPAQPHLRKYHEALREARMSPIAAALGFIHGLAEVDYAVVGVSSVGELDEVIRACDSRASLSDWRAFALDQESIINPTRWPPRPATH